jgi:hypothetical protein
LNLQSPPECPAGASCIGGYLTLDTATIRPGLYRATPATAAQIGNVQVTVTVETDSASWPPPCCIGDPARPEQLQRFRALLGFASS